LGLARKKTGPEMYLDVFIDIFKRDNRRDSFSPQDFSRTHALHTDKNYINCYQWSEMSTTS